jgi:hypothetical protein
MESYDALLDIEKMGVEFKDVNDEFAGALLEMKRPR